MLVDRSDNYFTRVLADGRVVDVVPLTFGRARIIISSSIDDFSWSDGW
jgi:hypothetical protein